MSYHSLGDVAQNGFYIPQGFRPLTTDENGSPRPEYGAVAASAVLPGFGWTQAQVDSGKVCFNQQSFGGTKNFLTQTGEWTNAGMFTVYVGSYIGDPNACLVAVSPHDLYKYKNRPDAWIGKLPYNAPFTVDGWSPYIRQIEPPDQPQPTPPGPQPQPPQPTPPGPLPTPPPPAGQSLADKIRALTPFERWVGIVALGTVAYYGIKYIAKETRKGRGGDSYDVPDPVPYRDTVLPGIWDIPPTLESPKFQANSRGGVYLQPMYVRSGNKFDRKWHMAY